MTRTVVQVISAGMLLSTIIIGPLAASAVASYGSPPSSKVLCYARGISCGNGPVLLPAVLGMH